MAAYQLSAALKPPAPSAVPTPRGDGRATARAAGTSGDGDAVVDEAARKEQTRVEWAAAATERAPRPTAFPGW